MFVFSEIMLRSLNFLSLLRVLKFVASMYCVALVLEIKSNYSLVHSGVLRLSNSLSSNVMVISNIEFTFLYLLEELGSKG